MARGGFKKQLMAELERERKAKLRSRLRELRQQIKAARAARRDGIRAVKVQCREARKKLRSVCAMRAERERTKGAAAIEAGRRELLRESTEAAQLGAAIRLSEGRGARAPRATAAERRQESDDAVRSNLPRELVPVFDRVKRHVKGSQWRSRTEAFLEWAHDNPGEVYAIQSEQAERDLARLVAEHDRAERHAHRARGKGRLPSLAEVPF